MDRDDLGNPEPPNLNEHPHTDADQAAIDLAAAALLDATESPAGARVRELLEQDDREGFLELFEQVYDRMRAWWAL